MLSRRFVNAVGTAQGRVAPPGDGEVVIGTFVGPLVVGRFVTPMLNVRVLMMLHLASFFVGGILVGVLPPGVRLLEPAMGAVVVVLLVFLMTFFRPDSFAIFLGTKILVSGSIAFVCALGGAYVGERMVGNLGEPTARATRAAQSALASLTA
jgi:hypothetical protein